MFKKEIFSKEKLSAFECGFDPKTSARIPFSIRFYLIAVIFLIFDIEIALIIPIPLIIKEASIRHISILTIFFFTILLLGTFHEWNQGALSWTK